MDNLGLGQVRYSTTISKVSSFDMQQDDTGIVQESLSLGKKGNELLDTNKNDEDKQADKLTEKEREKLKERADKLFEALNTGLALKFHEKSGEWYAVIQNKITQEIIKEVPPKYMLDLEAKLKDMIGLFLDKRI